MAHSLQRQIHQMVPRCQMRTMPRPLSMVVCKWRCRPAIVFVLALKQWLNGHIFPSQRASELPAYQFALKLVADAASASGNTGHPYHEREQKRETLPERYDGVKIGV